MFSPLIRVALITDYRVFTQNLVDLEKGPLRKCIISSIFIEFLTVWYCIAEEVVQALDDAWKSVQTFATNYWH